MDKEKADRVRLFHMLEAGEEAISFAKGKDRESLENDRQLTLSLIKSIEIIGEAAARTSPECRECLSKIPWRQIIGMRNRLIHAYFDINLAILWKTVTLDLPFLVLELKAYLGESSDP
jgi:uncharacterized protein with HEPN domain